jgi:predicted 2-oxoglutarate/Fe(II)-dependent dioxygenase YbiX
MYNVFTRSQCNDIINEIKSNPEIKWTSYGTLGSNNDLDINELSANTKGVINQAINNIVLQKASEVYMIPMEHLELLSRSPFIIKYDSTRPALDLHKDNADISFVVLLSNEYDFKDGGTYFNALNATLTLKQGECLIFPGQLVHSAKPITSGERYVLSGFVNISDAYKKDMRLRQPYTHWIPM